MKKKQTILIVPPRGIPLKALRIRLAAGIVLIVISCIGFIGYFIPIRTITNTVVEQNQRKNLTEQNRALLQKIISSLRMLQNVKDQISRLEIKKTNIITVSGNQPLKNDTLADTVDYREINPCTLMPIINKIELYFGPFTSITSDSGNVFDTIPVLYPVSSPYRISRKFGMAVDPFSGKERVHYGIDFIAETGTPVVATATGVIKSIEKHSFWGNKITIEHSGHYSTVYAHLGSVKVTVGKHVLRNDIIGEIGISGLTSGPHVHYEIVRDGIQVDPEEYLFPTDLFAEN